MLLTAPFSSCSFVQKQQREARKDALERVGSKSHLADLLTHIFNAMAPSLISLDIARALLALVPPRQGPRGGAGGEGGDGLGGSLDSPGMRSDPGEVRQDMREGAAKLLLSLSRQPGGYILSGLMAELSDVLLASSDELADAAEQAAEAQAVVGKSKGKGKRAQIAAAPVVAADVAMEEGEQQLLVLAAKLVAGASKYFNLSRCGAAGCSGVLPAVCYSERASRGQCVLRCVHSASGVVPTGQLV